MRFYTEITKSLRRWGIVFLLLVLIAILVFSILFAGRLQLTARAAQVVPVSLQSNLAANYHQDPFGVEIPVLEIDLIEEAIQDQQPDDAEASGQADEIVSELLTPVPTITPTPTASPTSEFAPTATQADGNPTTAASATATGVVLASSTPAATNTLMHTPTATASLPPGVTATITATPSATEVAHLTPSPTPTETVAATKTATVIGPNPTSTATATNTATVTNTATYTPTATSSATARPTNTSTPTPAENVCRLITISGFEVGRKQVRWTITNNSSQVITLTELFIDWPGSNEELKKIKLDHWAIWDEKDLEPPTHIISQWMGSQFRREIRAGESETLLFDFGDKTSVFGYFLRVTFNGSCVIEDDV